MIRDHDSTSIPESDVKGVVVGKTSDPQSIDYPHGLPIWTTLKWTTALKFRD